MVRSWIDMTGKVALLIWGTILSVIVTATMVSHWAPLPVPEKLTRISSSQEPFPTNASPNVALANASLHVLDLRCPCSMRIVQSLICRKALSNEFEKVLLVDNRDEIAEKLRLAGFQVEELSRDEIFRNYGFESAPMLVVTDSDSRIAYAGGYTSRKQGLDIDDVEIIRSIRSGVPLENKPVFGCAVSRELQQKLDPLGIKYGD